MRLNLALLAVVGCGPAVGDGDGGADGSTSEIASATTSGLAGTSSMSSVDVDTGASSTSEVDGGDEGVIFDVGASGGPPRPGDPPQTCELPERPNAGLFGTTPLGEVAMTAAVFAEDGGGKCTLAYRVFLATDPSALANEVENFSSTSPLADVIRISLLLPGGPPATGPWEGWVEQIRDGVQWAAAATVEVTSVTSLDASEPHVQATIEVTGEGSLEGWFFAPYCATVQGGSCGA